MARSRPPNRVSSGSNSSSTSTSPERGVDDDNDSFMLHGNDSTSSLGLSISQDISDVDASREIAERHRVSPVSRLPAELMIAIFARLSSAADLFHCMLVSKDWARNSVALLWHRPQTNKWPAVHRVTQSVLATNGFFDYANLIRRLNLSTLAPEISDGVLQPLYSCKRIERLTLTNCTAVTDNGLAKMIDGNRSLLALDVTGLDKITDRTMFAVAENCMRLQGLNVTNCKRLTDASLEAVARNCRHVKRLKFNGCSQLTDRSILNFAEHCHQILEIDLHGCNNLEDVSVTALITEGRYLRELRLAHCSRITDQAFLQLPMEATYESLRILDLTDCGELMDAGVTKIIAAAPRLRNLVLAKCRHITDRAISAITKLGKNLHYIHLGHCARLTDAGVIQLVKLCNRIRYIDLACCTLLTDDSVKQLATLPKLKRIGLVKCGSITDRSILALATKPRGMGITGPSSLERVHLSYCTNLSLTSIHSLLNHCPRLTHLSLTGVQAFLREDLLNFCRDAPPEFNDHQRDVFCVFSGAGVGRLRNYLNSDLSLGGPGGFDPDTLYPDNVDNGDTVDHVDDGEDEGMGEDDMVDIAPGQPPVGHQAGLGFIGVGFDPQAQSSTPDIILNIGGTPSPLSADGHQTPQNQLPPQHHHLPQYPMQPPPPQQQQPSTNSEIHPALRPEGPWHGQSLNIGGSSSGTNAFMQFPMSHTRSTQTHTHPEEQVTDMMGAVGMQDGEMGEATVFGRAAAPEERPSSSFHGGRPGRGSSPF